MVLVVENVARLSMKISMKKITDLIFCSTNCIVVVFLIFF